MKRFGMHVVFLCWMCAEFVLLALVPLGCFLCVGAMFACAPPVVGVLGAMLALLSLWAMPRVESIADAWARRLWP